MKKEIKIGLVIGFFIIILDLILLRTSKAFLFLAGIGLLIGIFPILFSLITESGYEKKKEELFLAFVRDIVESVNTGLPISKAIITLSKKEYGLLNSNIKKLANQIEFGIPLKTAFRTFAKDSNSKTISRAIELIIQAELSGGDISSILQNVSKNVSQIQELKKERQGRIFNMMIQGYILFFLFVAIMLFVDLKFIPMITSTINPSTMQISGFEGLGNTSGTKIVKDAFFYLILIQSFFCGLVIGKLAEGKIKAGLKHSIILLTFTFLVVTGSRALFG